MPNMEPRKTRRNAAPVIKTPDEISDRVSDIEKTLGSGLNELKSELMNKITGSYSKDDIDNCMGKILSFERNVKKLLCELKLAIKSNAQQADDNFRADKYLNAVVLAGVPENSTEDLIESSCEILRKCSTFINNNDINYCYRLGKISDNKSRPIAIFFTNRWKQDGAFKIKKNLKGSGCVMFEMLIKSKLNLLVNARKKLGTRNCWSWKGQISSSENENIKKIELELDF
ncbi:hypothetical protein JTB14_001445 [Gonioctena quinquepunctata]|nr:hypothetical protein JTB14_001445 [Gonioctena quinquepunctata]